MPWRAYFATLIGILALVALAIQAINYLWPPERHPMMIDAAAQTCPPPSTIPLPPGMTPQRVPLMDWRRTA